LTGNTVVERVHPRESSTGGAGWAVRRRFCHRDLFGFLRGLVRGLRFCWWCASYC
jgi:hypothetical protein